MVSGAAEDLVLAHGLHLVVDDDSLGGGRVWLRRSPVVRKGRQAMMNTEGWFESVKQFKAGIPICSVAQGMGLAKVDNFFNWSAEEKHCWDSSCPAASAQLLWLR